MLPYNFPHKRDQSYSLVEWVRSWFERRGDVLEAVDVQDDPQCYYKGDLRITRSGGIVQYIEIKCERSYTRTSSENLAIERWSDTGRRVPGGPWSTDADYYAHVYTDGLLVVMTRNRLIRWLDDEIARDPRAFPYRQVPNEGWTTGTYLVPRWRAREALGAWYREYNLS